MRSLPAADPGFLSGICLGGAGPLSCFSREFGVFVLELWIILLDLVEHICVCCSRSPAVTQREAGDKLPVSSPAREGDSFGQLPTVGCSSTWPLQIGFRSKLLPKPERHTRFSRTEDERLGTRFRQQQNCSKSALLGCPNGNATRSLLEDDFQA